MRPTRAVERNGVGAIPAHAGRILTIALALCVALAARAGGSEADRPTTARAGTQLTQLEVAPEVREALQLRGDVDAGQRAYESCAVCHLADGSGRADGTFPQLAGQHRSVLVKQLVDIREGRRRNPIMLPYAEALIDAQEIADVTVYIASLPTPQPEPAPQSEGLGQTLFERDCAGCHGLHGEGDAERFVPVLGGQHAPYLLRQVRAIAAGRRDNAHPEMGRRVARYTDAELQAVVAWAARLSGRPEGRDE